MTTSTKIEMLYQVGNGKEITQGLGANSKLVLDYRSFLSSADKWSQINNFIKKHEGEYIMGYFGYDTGDTLSHHDQSTFPKVFLFVPQVINTLSAADAGKDGKIFSVEPYLKENEGEFLNILSKGIEWTEERAGRLTLARKIVIAEDLDLKSVLKHPISCTRPDLHRTFYLRCDEVSLAGVSPELLLHGTTKKFCTYKLSGTNSQTDSSTTGFPDEKIALEFGSSMYDMRNNLSVLGETTSVNSCINTGVVRHYLKEFTIVPKKPVSAVDCIRAIWPFGTSHVSEGLKFIVENETSDRGPYYGLIGVITPSGEMQFSQILRTYFKKGTQNFAWAGCAVIPQSTPEAELEETCMKFRSFPTIDVKGEKND